MRKSLKIVLTTSILLVIVGLLLCLYFFVIAKDDNIYVEDISLTKNDLILKVDDTYTITNIMEVVPANYNVQIMCHAENSKYVSIVNGYTIKANSVGETKIMIKALCDKDTYLDEVLNISVVPKPVYPESFSFEKSKVVLEMGKSEINKIVSSTIYNAEPTITYSVDNICSYNYETGEVLALGIGTTEVTVKFANDSTNIEKSFEVVVSGSKATISLRNCEVDNGEFVTKIKKSTPSRLYFDMFDAAGDATSFNVGVMIKTNGCEYRTITIELGYVKFVCDSVGESSISIYNIEDETIFVEVKIIAED